MTSCLIYNLFMCGGNFINFLSVIISSVFQHKWTAHIHIYL